jgi:hypothetical protein
MPSSIAFCSFVLLAAVAGTTIPAAALALDPPRASSIKSARRANLPPPDSPASNQGSFIVLRDGLLNVRIENTSLEWALKRISQQSGVPISSVGGLDAHPLSIQFERLSLEDGLRRILKDHDFFLFLAADGRAPALRGVWVYPKGQGHALMPLAPPREPSQFHASSDLTHPNPTARARALEALAEREGQQALPAVLQGLMDSDESVRSRALFTVLNAAVAIPQDALEEVVRNDSSPLVRSLAMEAITNANLQEPSRARQIAEFALQDADPQVREQAQWILDMASGPREGIEPVQGQEGPSDGNQQH